MRDAFEWAAGSHVLMMASDLETEPATVKDLIASARQGYDIVTGARWTRVESFRGYHPLKHRLNLVFQKGFGQIAGVLQRAWTQGANWTESQKEWRSKLIEGMGIWYAVFEELGAGDQTACPSRWMELEEVGAL